MNSIYLWVGLVAFAAGIVIAINLGNLFPDMYYSGTVTGSELGLKIVAELIAAILIFGGLILMYLSWSREGSVQKASQPVTKAEAGQGRQLDGLFMKDKAAVAIGLVAFVVGTVFLLNEGNLFPSLSYGSTLQGTPLLALMLFEFATLLMTFGGTILIAKGLDVHVTLISAVVIIIIVIMLFIFGVL